MREQLDSAHPAEQFYQLVRQLIKLHIQYLKTKRVVRQRIGRDSDQKEYRTLRITSAREIGHTYTALKLLRELPDSVLLVHSVSRASTLCRSNPDISDNIFSISTLHTRDIRAQTYTQIPVLIIDTVQLLEQRHTSFDKLMSIINAFDTIHDVRLFVYLE